MEATDHSLTGGWRKHFLTTESPVPSSLLLGTGDYLNNNLKIGKCWWSSRSEERRNGPNLFKLPITESWRFYKSTDQTPAFPLALTPYHHQKNLEILCSTICPLFKSKKQIIILLYRILASFKVFYQCLQYILYAMFKEMMLLRCRIQNFLCIKGIGCIDFIS